MIVASLLYESQVFFKKNENFSYFLTFPVIPGVCELGLGWVLEAQGLHGGALPDVRSATPPARDRRYKLECKLLVLWIHFHFLSLGLEAS